MRVPKRSVLLTSCGQAACVLLVLPRRRRESEQRTMLTSASRQLGATQTGQVQSVPKTTKTACLQAGLHDTFIGML